jgi:hypothetical protein
MCDVEAAAVTALVDGDEAVAFRGGLLFEESKRRRMRRLPPPITHYHVFFAPRYPLGLRLGIAMLTKISAFAILLSLGTTAVAELILPARVERAFHEHRNVGSHACGVRLIRRA